MGSIVITGGSAGIGAAAAIELARLGHRVLVTGRSRQKLTTVHQHLIAAAPPDVNTPAPFLADLAALREVHRLADHILDRFPEIDVLVNNAAVQPSRRQVSADGFELTLAVNHLAQFLLTNLLVDVIRSNTGRVITTSSSTHHKGYFDFSDLQMEKRWRGRLAYGRSKLANILFTTELNRRTRLPASSFHPGAVSTDLNRDSPFVRVVKPFEKYLLTTPEKGADTLVWLATSPEGAAPAAAYYADRKPCEVSAAAQDPHLAARLWDISADLVGLDTRSSA